MQNDPVQTLEAARTIIEAVGGIFLGVLTVMMHSIRDDIRDLRDRMGRVESELMK